MKILLFGSSGMLGTAIESVCKEKQIELIGLNHDDIEITDPSALKSVIEKYLPSVVINSVAIVGVNPCEVDPLGAFNVNTIAVSHLAKLCESKGIVFVQTSTHAVFDGTKEGYYTEDDQPHPISIYSASKYMSEIFAMNLCKKHYVVRFPTMFGRRRNKKPGFVDKVLENIRKGKELKIAADKIDSVTYALDAAERLVWLLEHKAAYGLYHIANDGIISYYDFVKALVELLKSNVKVAKAKDSDFSAAGHKPLKTAMKSAKLLPLRSWEESLQDYVSSYLKEK